MNNHHPPEKINVPGAEQGAKNLPRLSVMVPVYNQRDFLPSCLTALKEQVGLSPSEWEVIVVDDGSQDGSAEIAAHFVGQPGPRFRLLRLEKNQGAAVSRNQGAKAAAGEILVFVDADVALTPTALSELAKVFAERPEVTAAVGRYSEKPATAGIINLYHNAFTRYHHDLSPPEIDWFWGALSAVRKEAFWAVGGFDERYQAASAEDMELGRALAEHGFKIIYCPRAEGAHGHHFTLAGMLKNDFQKAVLGTKLLLRGRLPRRAPAFANYRNLATPPLILVPLLFALGYFSSLSWLTVFLCLGLVFVINDPFYLYLSRLFGGNLIWAILLHWLQMLVMVSGALAGALGHLLGRSPYGRPGWV